MDRACHWRCSVVAARGHRSARDSARLRQWLRLDDLALGAGRYECEEPVRAAILAGIGGCRCRRIPRCVAGEFLAAGSQREAVPPRPLIRAEHTGTQRFPGRISATPKVATIASTRPKCAATRGWWRKLHAASAIKLPPGSTRAIAA